MSLAAAKAFLAQNRIEDERAAQDEYDQMMDEKQKMERDAGWGKLIGQWGLTGAATIAAVASGGALTPLAAAVIGGVGARVGSEVGETNWGRRGGVEDKMKLKKRAFGADVRRQAERNIKDRWEGFGKSQDTQALMAAGETYLAAGGEIPGTKEFSDSGGFKSMFANPVNAPKGQAAFGIDKGTTIGDLMWPEKEARKQLVKKTAGTGFDITSLDVAGDTYYQEYEKMLEESEKNPYIDPFLDEEWT